MSPLPTRIRLGAACAAAAPAAARTAASLPASPSAHPFAAPDIASGAPAMGVGGLGEVTLALGAVLGVIFVLAWLVRRVRGVAGAASALGVLAEVRLGPKERAVLVKVGAAQLLLGVAPGQVSTLHVLAQPVHIDGETPPGPPGGGDPRAVRPSFRALLRRSLGRS
jgi:flagellar protein FliO/FliZ